MVPLGQLRRMASDWIRGLKVECGDWRKTLKWNMYQILTVCFIMLTP